jgi:hypothetical protein
MGQGRGLGAVLPGASQDRPRGDEGLRIADDPEKVVRIIKEAHTDLYAR